MLQVVHGGEAKDALRKGPCRCGTGRQEKAGRAGHGQAWSEGLLSLVANAGDSGDWTRGMAGRYGGCDGPLMAPGASLTLPLRQHSCKGALLEGRFYRFPSLMGENFLPCCIYPYVSSYQKSTVTCKCTRTSLQSAHTALANQAGTQDCTGIFRLVLGLRGTAPTMPLDSCD